MTQKRTAVVAIERITKGQVDQAIKSGITHAKFKNKGVQKRAQKEQERIKRSQERRDRHYATIAKRTKQMMETRVLDETPVPMAKPEPGNIYGSEMTDDHIAANIEMIAAEAALESIDSSSSQPINIGATLDPFAHGGTPSRKQMFSTVADLDVSKSYPGSPEPLKYVRPDPSTPSVVLDSMAEIVDAVEKDGEHLTDFAQVDKALEDGLRRSDNALHGARVSGFRRGELFVLGAAARASFDEPVEPKNPELIGVDPGSPDLTEDQKLAIVKECRDNPAYFTYLLVSINGTERVGKFMEHFGDRIQELAAIPPRQTGGVLIKPFPDPTVMGVELTEDTEYVLSSDLHLGVTHTPAVAEDGTLIPKQISDADDEDCAKDETFALKA